MLSPTAPQTYTKEHFDREWRKLLDELDADQRADVQRLCWVDWFAPELLGLLEEFHDRPAKELSPLIRRLVIEQGFVDENGDSVIDEGEMSHLDGAVALLVTALERVRQRCNELGRWCDAPASTPMFG